MALDQKFFKKSTAATGLADQEQGLILHLDANDVDSYDGDGSIWYDINGHEVNIPLADKASNLKVHLNASNTASYNGVGTTWTDLTDTKLNAIISGPSFGSDTVGYFDFSGAASDLITIPDSSFVDMQSNSTMEVWLQKPATTTHIINKGAGDGNESYALWATSSTIYFYRYNTGGGTTTALNISTSNVGTDEYMHVAITVGSSGDFKMYLNGGNLVTSSLSSFRDNSHSVRIGNYNTSNSYPYTKRLSVVRYYNTALTAAEIGQNYRAGNFLNYSSIITSKHEATQGSLVTVPPTQGTLHTGNLQINLDANSYSGSGNWLDGANNYDASISAATYVNNDNSDYFDFAGSTNNPVSISYNSILNAAARSWEFWVWFDTDAMNFFGGTWGSANNTKTVLFRMKDSNNAIRAQVYDGAGTSVEPTTANNVVNTNEWNHIVFTSDNSDNSFKIYINGVEKYSDTLSIDMNTSSTDNFIIGAGGGYSADRLNGRIAQFRYYNAALNSAQVNTNYNATKDLYQGVTSLVASYDANGYSSGNWLDTSGNDRHITITGATHTDDNNSDYFTFDGNDYMQTPSSTEFNVGNTGTFEMWHWLDSTYDETLLYQGNSSYTVSTLGYHFRVNNGKYQMLTYNNGNFILASGSSSYFNAATNAWHHLVITFGSAASGSAVKIYLDGVEVKSTTLSSDANTGNYPVSIGRRERSVAYSYYNGRMGQIRFYKGPMTAAQVNTNYNATKALYQNPTLKANFDPANYTSGPWVDSVNSNSGTINNATFDEEVGNFFDFNRAANNQNIVVSDSASLSPTSTLSIEVIVSPNDFSNHQRIIWKNGSYGLYASAGGLYTFFINSTSTVVQTTLNETNKFKHIVCTYDGSHIKIYINGILKNSTSKTGAITDNASNFTIGGDGTGSRYYNGQIGFVRLYEDALTAAQVAQNYLATKSKYPNGINFTGNNISWNANGYFSFNGSNKNFATSGAPSALINATGFTVSAWFWRTNGATGSNTIVGQSHDNGNSGQNWILTASGSGTVYFHIYGNDDYSGVSNLVSYETWTHLAGVVEDDGVKRIYKNGVVQLSTASGKSADTVSYNTFVGNLGAINWHDGRIGAVKYYKKPLTADELLADFNATKGTYGL